jgi:hypothetical protein
MGPLPPVGSKTAGTLKKGVGSAFKTAASANTPAMVTVIFILRGFFFIFGILLFADVVLK